MNYSIFFLLVGIIILGLILISFVFISSNKKGIHKLDVEKYRVKYLEIENNLKKDDDLSYHMTIINADKLLDQALKDIGFSGSTMAERLKSANLKFKNNNKVWNVHKLRNRIVHEQNVVLTYRDCEIALLSFKEALKDLGAI